MNNSDDAKLLQIVICQIKAQRLPSCHNECNAIEFVWADVKGFLARCNKAILIEAISNIFMND